MMLLAMLLSATLYEQAMALHQAGKYAEAVKTYEQAWEKGERVPGFMYNRACAEARAGMIDAAFTHLELATKNSVVKPEMLEKDDDLVSLRHDERWPKLVSLAQETAHPCAKKPHGFDFWVGQWTVQNPQGQRIGQSRVERILDGCVIHESWTSALGNKGQSFNVFDTESGKWRQTWVDDQGRQTDYVGAFEGTSLVFKARINGQATTMTFTPLEGGRVRQFITQEGQPPWEGIYVPQQAARSP